MAFFLKWGCGPDGGVKGNIGKIAFGRSGLDVSAALGLCFGPGSAPTGTTVLMVKGSFYFIGINGIANLYRVAAFPPGRTGGLEDIPAACVCGNFQVRAISYGVYESFFLSPFSPSLPSEG